MGESSPKAQGLLGWHAESGPEGRCVLSAGHRPSLSPRTGGTAETLSFLQENRDEPLLGSILSFRRSPLVRAGQRQMASMAGLCGGLQSSRK